MSDLRADMKERVMFVLNDEGLEVPDDDILDSIINQCARVALLETKQHLNAFYPMLQNVAGLIEGDPAKTRMNATMAWIRNWDTRLAGQA